MGQAHAPAPAASRQRGAELQKSRRFPSWCQQQQPLALGPVVWFCSRSHQLFPFLQEHGMCFVIFPVRAMPSRRLGNRHPTRLQAGATDTLPTRECQSTDPTARSCPGTEGSKHQDLGGKAPWSRAGHGRAAMEQVKCCVWLVAHGHTTVNMGLCANTVLSLHQTHSSCFFHCYR